MFPLVSEAHIKRLAHLFAFERLGWRVVWFTRNGKPVLRWWRP